MSDFEKYELEQIAAMRAAEVRIRRERIATAIFAAMQANPNWMGSLDDAARAIKAADSLIIALDQK